MNKVLIYRMLEREFGVPNQKKGERSKDRFPKNFSNASQSIIELLIKKHV